MNKRNNPKTFRPDEFVVLYSNSHSRKNSVRFPKLLSEKIIENNFTHVIFIDDGAGMAFINSQIADQLPNAFPMRKLKADFSKSTCTTFALSNEAALVLINKFGIEKRTVFTLIPSGDIFGVKKYDIKIEE